MQFSLQRLPVFSVKKPQLRNQQRMTDNGIRTNPGENSLMVLSAYSRARSDPTYLHKHKPLGLGRRLQQSITQLNSKTPPASNSSKVQIILVAYLVQQHNVLFIVQDEQTPFSIN
ncbi:hypothetical protein COEREDRAFT_12828 [Coemansia reversa NRRL 1564]|uniref:Uncharacterized protein n=1 Tax=Coemansia reversa (strain ATCC 12441 / NRRL 1564) TaxID=763665 RepID=A0A2G5B094_COERN|nr:hypothetical protein COEREDRAFT_12828 [Coemansia reversa NRRL 1564]|eukprot:PIA12461.1 hypothetical protein COEREDRAFT_12828 [Coemansia reversa NRRL 1564]